MISLFAEDVLKSPTSSLQMIVYCSVRQIGKSATS